MRAKTFHRATQSGAALLIGLILLLIMTVLGLSASNVSIMQERMAGNVTQNNIAFQRAEETLREIEQRVAELAEGGSGGLGVIPTWGTGGAPGMDLLVNDCSMSAPTSWDWNNAGTIPWRIAPTTGREYLIVDLSDYVEAGLTFASACRPVSEVGMGNAGEYYLIVARGASPAGDSEAIVQSIFYWPQ